MSKISSMSEDKSPLNKPTKPKKSEAKQVSDPIGLDNL